MSMTTTFKMSTLEPDIPGRRPVDGAHGVAEVLAVSRCAARMTPWRSW